MRTFPLSKTFHLLEPGPVVLLEERNWNQEESEALWSPSSIGT